MPWCEPCERFWNPSTVTTEGACPTCGAAVDAPTELEPPAPQRVPWHFWVFLTAAAVYLIWRAIDGIALLF